MFDPSKKELLRLLEQERKAHRAEIANLLDRIADMANKPWTLPPRDVFPEALPEPADNYEYLPL